MSLQTKVIFEFGWFRLNPAERLLLREQVQVRLPPKAFDALVVLVENRGRLLGKDELLRTVWPDTFVEESNLAQHVSILRKALRDGEDGFQYIETVPRHGYRFIAEVRELGAIATKVWIANLWKIAVPVLLVALLVAGGLYYRSHQQRQRLTEKDTIVLADFTNSTGDPIFDDTLKTALNVSLRQSPFLNVLSDGDVAKTLQQMTRPASTKLTSGIARELCLRAGSKAYLAGSIAGLGNQYVLGLKAVNCQDGDTLAEEQVTAASKEKVLDTLGEAASKLRTELGESLATVQKFDVPLEQATTSSLEALKAYSLGRKAAREKGPAAALPYDQRAIELDPNFAMGYRAVGAEYTNLSELGRASEYLTKAFQLREHASEREKLVIAADYYESVTGEVEKAAQTYQEEIESYPRESGAYGGLGNEFAEQGQYEKAVEMTRQALRFAPDDVGWYENLATYSVAMQRFDAARQIIHEAQAKKMDDSTLHSVLYILAFFGADSGAMVEQQRWFAGKPAYENYGLALASDAEAYVGHLRKARELTKRAVDSAIQADNKENGALLQAIAAQREAAYGNTAEARQSAAKALKLAPASPGGAAEATLAFAMAGDIGRAGSLAQDLAKRFPARHADALALAACDSGTIGTGQKEHVFRSQCPASRFTHRVREYSVRTQCFLSLPRVCARRGIPGVRAGQCRRRRVSEDYRPQRHRLELLDGSVGASGRGSGQRHAGENFSRTGAGSGCRCRPRPGARRLQGFPHPLERRRPGHSHPEGSQSGVREAAIAA
jgi:DNA-binding winged helix-turn-helix (wHTH) protein/tetratricopeptide (TPR) repeat protein